MNNFRRTLIFVATVLLIDLGLRATVGVASAQPAVDDASEEALDAAERLTALGQEAHNAGEFEDAIKHFHEALTHAVDPELYYNLGQSYRLNQQPREALEFYLKYVEAEPSGRVSTLARQSVEITRKQIKKLEEKEAAEEKSDSANSTPKPTSTTTQPTSVVEPASPPESSGGNLRLAGMILGAVGVAGLGVSGFYANRSRSLSNELSEDRPNWSSEALDKFSEGEDAERRAIVAGVAGGVLLTGGIILYVVGLDDTETKPILAASSDRVEVAISGRF